MAALVLWASACDVNIISFISSLPSVSCIAAFDIMALWLHIALYCVTAGSCSMKVIQANTELQVQLFCECAIVACLNLHVHLGIATRH